MVGSGVIDGANMEGVEIDGMSVMDFLKKAYKLEDEHQDLKEQLTLINNAKAGLEKTLNKEKTAK